MGIMGLGLGLVMRERFWVVRVPEGARSDLNKVFVRSFRFAKRGSGPKYHQKSKICPVTKYNALPF